MIIRRFLEWSQTAPVRDRARAAGLLVEAYLRSRMSEAERRSAEAAMVFLLDDPSPNVRFALADALADDETAPREVVCALARDQIEVATRVLSVSPVFRDADLVDFVADGRCELQRVIASRSGLSASVCAALAEVGHEAAMCVLLDNADATIAAFSLKRTAERFGAVPEVRARLLDRADLPCDVRHGLIFEIGGALSRLPFVAATVGAERIERVTRDACQSAGLQLAMDVPARELPALVEHLRMSGKLTPAFLIQALCSGNLDFFAASLTSLSGQSPKRVRGILVDGRKHAMRALYRASGLVPSVIEVFVDATLMWRERMTGGASIDRSIPMMLVTAYAERAEGDPDLSGLLRLLDRMELRSRRQVAREIVEAALSKAA